MSRTDNTRPFDIQAEDPTLPRVKVEHGRPRFIDPDDHEFTPVYYGGFNSVRRNARKERKRLNRTVRAHKRQSLHRILTALDVTEADMPPARAERRCVQWNLG